MTNEHTLEERFKTAVEIVQHLPKDGPVTTSNEEKLMFYGLFKQATVGPCTVGKPGMFYVVERDAWKKNGDMTKDEAMNTYLERLLDKINEVEKTHDTKEWLKGDLFEFMVPKFAVIGKHYGDTKESEGRPPSPSENATPLLSDTEYCDAVEEDLRSRSSSYELQDSPRSKKQSELKPYCQRVESELKNISEQIERLSNAVDQRHSSLLNVFKKATVYMFVPKGVSWTTIFFFIVWPFIAHFLMRFLKLFWNIASAGLSTLWGPSAEDEEGFRFEEIERQEREFHSFVRQQIIVLLFFLTLYFTSYWIIRKYKSTADNDSLYAGEEDYFVYRISVWMCTFSLATSLGSITLLPFSIIGSELLHRYEANYYIQWLSLPLINSLWDYVFMLSNLSLFVLLPFSYFFLESSGFGKGKNGIMQRVYETLAVCALLIIVVLCLCDIILTLLGWNVSLLSIKQINLSFIYSCVSLFGVVLLLISTPVGFAQMFIVVNEITTICSSDSEEAAVIARLEKQFIQFRKQDKRKISSPPRNLSYRRNTRSSGKEILPLLNGCIPSKILPEGGDAPEPKTGSLWVRQEINNAKQGITLMMVSFNILKHMFGYSKLPVYDISQGVEGHFLGLVGMATENAIIVYIMIASLVGIYSIPYVRLLRPKAKSTSMTAIIINCSLVLILSSAFPILANILGLTTFKLMGHYGALNWLTNFRLVLAYNVSFTVVSVITVFTHLTTPVRSQILKALNYLRCYEYRSQESLGKAV